MEQKYEEGPIIQEQVEIHLWKLFQTE